MDDIKVKEDFISQIQVPVDISKVNIKKMISYGKNHFKYFGGYKDDDEIKPLCISLPLGKNYYPEIFLEGCKYVVKANKMIKFVND